MSPEPKAGHGGDYPPSIKTPGQKALYDNLGKDEALALRVHQAVIEVAPHGFRGHAMRERKIRKRLDAELHDAELAERILQIVKNHGEY